MTEEDKLYPDLTQNDGIPDPSPTQRIKVSKLPQKTTEDGLKYFFENKKMFGGCDVETVDYDPTTNTAVVIFKETDDVERILGKMPILFEDTSINIERHYFEEEAEDVEYNECTIEVTGMSQKTTQQNIQMYFESKKGANADVLVRYKEEDEMYLVKFESETVVDAVLNKRHILDGSDLQVRRHIPFQAESTYPNQVVISGLDIKTTHDSLRNFLEARSKTDINKIMYGEIDGTAIIVFKTQPDIEKLKEECKKRQLDGCYLRVDTVPVSKCIIVSNIKEGTSKDAVLFYFDNKKKSGVEGVSNVDLNTKDRTCIVHFLDTEAPTEACKKGHTIEGHQVKVDIYYECIGSKASEDGPKFRPLDPIDCDLDIRKLQFLINSKAGKDELEKKLKLCYAKVLQWPENKSSSLKIECLLTADVKNCTKLMKTWETDVNNCLKKILLELRTEELETLQDAWKPVMDIVRSITITDPDLVALSVEKDKCHLCLVGYDKQVRELNKKIKQIISDVNADIEKKKRQLKENVSLKHPQLMILVMCNFPKEMKSTYHELEVKVNIEKDEISFEGLSTNVTSAKVKMYEKLQTMSHIPVERASSCFITFLKTAEVEEFILDQFRRKKKVGIWEIQENDLIMHALSEKEAHACVQIFRSCVIETRIDIDERQFDVLKSDLGKKEVERITNNYSKNLVHISHDTKSTITVLCTNSNEAKAIREDIKNFFLENIYEKIVVNLSSSEIRLLKQDFYKLKLTAIEKEMENDNVKIILNINALIIEGKARNINTAQSKVESIIKTITIKQHVISKPGIMKFMSTELGKTKVKTVEKQLNVIIETAVDIEGPEQEVEERLSYNTFSSSNLMETAQCNVNGGRLIVSVLGDITLVNVDVIVNAANEDMDHRGGLAKVIVDKGGKEIQKECTQHVKQHGKLTEGSVFCSKAGKLNCKMIVHTVGPVWKGGKHDEEDSLKDCVLKSLKETDNRSLTSIAIPAVSTGVYGYPKDKATRVIVKAVQDYLSQNPNSKITKVCLCDVKEDTVSLFVDGMKKYFGKVSLRVRSEDAKLWKSVTDHKGPQSGPGEQKSKTVQFGSISVKVVKGQLAQQKADVIVNSTSRDLRLEGGMLSKSLLMAAGPTLQTECDKQYPKGIKEGEVAKTSGGKLSCKHVFHGCLPSWQYEQSSIKILETFVLECLKIGTQNNHRSIAFPSLGTGKLGYPVDQVARHMFSCVESFSTSMPNSSIKEVFFVVYEQDRNSIQAFEDEFKRRLGYPDRSEEGFTKETRHKERGRPRSARPTTSQGRPYEVHLNKIQLKVYQGDITSARVDVIVNSSNTECDLSKGGVSQAIMKKGGREVTNDINKQKDVMKKDGLVVTTGGKQMPCEKIIHLDMQNNSKDLRTKILNVLMKTDELQKHTLAMPALGTTNANVPVEKIASHLISVIYNYKPQHLQEVHIIIYQSSMLKSFIDSIGKCMDHIREKSDGLQEMGIGPTKDNILQTQVNTTEPDKSLSVVTITIYGKDKSVVAQAVNKLEKAISDEITEKNVTGKIVKELTKDQEADLQKIAAWEGVEIKVDKNKEKIVIKGFIENVSIALEKANDVIKMAEHNKQTGQKAKLVSGSVQWYTICKQNGKDDLKEYPSHVNLQLEEDFQKLKQNSIYTNQQGNKFTVDFSMMEEFAENNKGVSLKVVRKSKINDKDSIFEPPKHWDLMDDKENYSVSILKSASQEYIDVMQKFHKSVGSTRPIVEIHRIQNKTLYQQYVAKKNLIDSTNPKGHQNEKTLWHGFAVDAMESINKFGFNRGYCGKNATAYGDGVYFARDASYSANNTYSVPDGNGNKRIYMCKVLTGEYTVGGYGIRIPPQKSPTETHILYDCVVDNTSNPIMYIIFHDTQAYPEYMILFK